MERTAGLKTGCGKDIMLSPDQMVPVHCTWLATSPSRSAAANISSHKPAGCPAIAARISRSLRSLPVTVTGFTLTPGRGRGVMVRLDARAHEVRRPF